MMYELKGFCGAAKVYSIKSSHEQIKELYSYGMLVARIIINFDTMTYTYECGDYHSQEITKHQKEFFKENYLTDKDIKHLFKEGKLEIEV